MTFTVQEVPAEWDTMTDEEFQMYDLTFNDILTEQDQCTSTMRLPPHGIKLEDAVASVPTLYHTTATASPLRETNVATQYHVTASPSSRNMQWDSYSTFMPSPEAASDVAVASPSNSCAYSSSCGSPYSATQEPAPSLQPDEYRGYANTPQQHYSAPHLPPSNQYGYYMNNYWSGKRRLRDDELTSDEYEKRRSRRERNKLAALRCRNRRRERIEALEKETNEIEEQNAKVELDISKLQSQIEELKSILKGHSCHHSDVQVSGGAAQSSAGD